METSTASSRRSGASSGDGSPPQEGRRNAASRLIRNTLANGLGGMAGVAVGILLTPFIIARLGLEEYGVWTLALTLTFAGGYAGLADLGLEAATARYVAEARSDGDDEAVNRTVATTLAFFLVVGGVLALAMVALSASLTDVFSVPEGMRHSARLAFALVGGQLALEMPLRAFVAVLEGSQRFTVYQGVELTRTLIQAALWVGALLAGMGVAALAAGLFVSTLAALLLYWALAHRAVPGLHASPRRATRAELRRLLGFGSSVLGLRLAGTIYRQMDKVILAVAMGPAAVGLYEVANKIHLSAQTVQSMSVSALLPAAATARREPDVLRDMYLRGSCYTTAASIPFVIGAMVLAEPLIRTWIGTDVAGAVHPAQLLLLYLLINVVHNVGSVMVVALGILRVMVIATLVNVAINLVVSILLVGPLGVEGVVLGTVAGNAAIWPVYLRLYLRTFDVSPGQWLRRILIPNLPGIVAQGCVLVPLAIVIHDASSLMVVGLVFLASVVASLVAFVAFGLRRTEREVLLSTLRSAAWGRLTAPAQT